MAPQIAFCCARVLPVGHDQEGHPTRQSANKLARQPGPFRPLMRLGTPWGPCGPLGAKRITTDPSGWAIIFRRHPSCRQMGRHKKPFFCEEGKVGSPPATHAHLHPQGVDDDLACMSIYFRMFSFYKWQGSPLLLPFLPGVVCITPNNKHGPWTPVV